MNDCGRYGWVTRNRGRAAPPMPQAQDRKNRHFCFHDSGCSRVQSAARDENPPNLLLSRRESVLFILFRAAFQAPSMPIFYKASISLFEHGMDEASRSEPMKRASPFAACRATPEQAL